MIKILLFLGITFFANPVYAACTGPVGAVGDVIFNTTNDVLQGCTERGWFAFHEVGSPPPGTVMPDGSVYAGLSPDGDVPMYTTPADSGQFSWNDGTSNNFDTAMVNCGGTEASCDTGQANTALLVGLGTGPSPAPYVAARHCDNLTAHGHSDWYLPAKNELNVLYTNRTAIGGFNLTGAWPAGSYRSSSEVNSFNAWRQQFSDGVQVSFTAKSVGNSVRCVRK